MRKPWNKGIKLSELPQYQYMGFQKGHTHWKHPNARRTQFREGMSAHSIPHSEETKQKLSLSRRGKAVGDSNPSWKGGITPLLIKLRRLAEYKEWQKAVFKRDNHTCRKCGVRGGRLTPHHLFAFSFLVWSFGVKTVAQARKEAGLWNKRNGVTLCDDCHKHTSNYAWRASKRPRDRYIYAPVISALFLLSLVLPINTEAATFGYTSAGASAQTIGSNDDELRAVTVNATTDSFGGTVDSVSVYSRLLFAGSRPATAAIYNTSSGLLSPQSSEISITNTGIAWNTWTFTSGPSVAASTNYWPAIFFGDTGDTAIINFDSGSSGDGKTQDPASYPTFPNPATFTNSTGIFSIYATYTASTSTPTVTTSAATSIGTSTATLNGNITNDGGASSTIRGFAWGTNSNLSGGDTATTTETGTFGVGTFTNNLTSLTPNTTYYFRAYAVNSVGTSTGSILNFTTEAEGGGGVAGCEYITSANDTTDTNQYTFSSQSLGSAASDRYIVIVTGARKAGAGFTLSSVTVGGQSATIVAQVTNTATNSDTAGMAIAAVPSGTTGDVVVTWSTTVLRSFIGVYRLDNLSTPLAPATTTSTASNPTGAINTVNGDCAIGSALTAAATTASWTGLSEDFDSTVESFVTYTGAHTAITSASTPLTMTATFGSAVESAGVFAVWSGATPPSSDPAPAQPVIFFD